MILISWNCRGLGQPSAVHALRDLIRCNKPSVVFLMETKMKFQKLDRIRKSLKFDFECCVDPVGKSGGLALWWNNDVQLTVEEKSKNLIDTSIHCVVSGSWRASFIYGNPIFEKRKGLWTNLSRDTSLRGIPWMCIGDFNDYTSLEEKEGGSQKIHPRMECFREFLFNNSFLEIQSKGQRFTWWNKREGSASVREKIDRAVMNREWMHVFEWASLIALPMIGSDHTPLLLNLCPKPSRMGVNFRFEAFWMDHEDCEGVVADGWNGGATGSSLFKVVKNHKSCSKGLKNWSKEVFGDRKKLISEIKIRINTLQLGIHSEESNREERRLESELDGLWEMEEIFWGQRSRVKWLDWGDDNTPFFHATTVQRRQRNKVVRLKNENGDWVQGDDDIAILIGDYFGDLFNCHLGRRLEVVDEAVPRRVSDVMNEKMLRPVTREEVKQVAFQMGSRKSPGPDGFSGMFYKRYWHIIGEDIFEGVKEFFESGYLLKELNRTDLVLIPKVKNPESLGQFRPISCCNYTYKIIAKLMANRMKPFLADLITPNQSAFLANRQIQDNIVVAQELFHHLRKKTHGTEYEVAIKLDMNKAYDRLEWDFLERVLQRLGFESRWIHMLMQCVTTVSFSVLFNGERKLSLCPKRGLRQGDPLSPYLFILASDCLSNMILKEVQDENLDPLHISNSCPPLSHLLFADDSLFFTKASPQNCNKLLDIINRFCHASGQEINLNKSGVFFSKNTPLEVRKLLSVEIRIPLLGNTGKYLGLPSEWGLSKVRALGDIKGRVAARLEGWKSQTLSMAGKEILIKSVATAIPAYSMTIFKYPKSLCDDLNSMMANFWWGKPGKERSIHWRSWEKLTTSKKEGGLGFRDLHSFNLALLAKQAWRLIKNPESLWASTLKGIYFPYDDFWHAEKQPGASWSWNSILEGRDLIKQGSLWRIGNGHTIKVWSDNWVPGVGVPRAASSAVFQNPVMRVSSLLDSTSSSWNLGVVKVLFEEESVKAIMRIPLNNTNQSTDEVVWPYNKLGKYEVKSGYHFAISKRRGIQNNPTSSSFIVPSELWSLIWKCQSLPKVKNFLWRCCSNAIPTNANLFKRKCNKSPICPICEKEEESVEHMLLLCPWTRPVWFGCFSLVIDMVVVSRLESWLMGRYKDFSELGTEGISLFSLLACVCWKIWNARNKWVFEQVQPSPKEVIISAEKLCSEYASVKRGKEVLTPISSRSGELSSHDSNGECWLKPPCGWLKVNCDGSFIHGSKEAAISSVCRSEFGDLIAGRAYKVWAPNPLVTEALALRDGLLMASALKSMATIFEGDNADLMTPLINMQSPCHWEIQGLINDIKMLASSLGEVSFSLVRRTANRVADWAAKKACDGSLPILWPSSPPRSLVILLDDDCRFVVPP